jgi:hypothetical protein
MVVSAPESFTARRFVDPGGEEASEAAISRLAGSAAAALVMRLMRQKSRLFMELTPYICFYEEPVCRPSQYHVPE